MEGRSLEGGFNKILHAINGQRRHRSLLEGTTGMTKQDKLGIVNLVALALLISSFGATAMRIGAVTLIIIVVIMGRNGK